MLLNILMMILSSEMTKQLIALGVKKLLDHKSDGITKEVATTMLDGIAMSRANDANNVRVKTTIDNCEVAVNAFDMIKKAL